ncbi:MAG: glycine--tRNA ligase [Clostridiales bacterium]|nr:glycine--tRNA ligase [Clostridiales bacterium]
MMEEITMKDLANFAKTYGFIYQGSEIYGGLANTWDYGILGARLKNNLKDMWRKFFIQLRDNAYEIDASILMHPKVWEASGHIKNFSDPLLDCKECKMRVRADKLIEEFDSTVIADKMTDKEMEEFIKEKKIPCPNCKASNFTSIREFNLMFETTRGVTKDSKSTIYLRPENAQGEYVNFLNVLRTARTKLPFSIGQIGKAFRNEITPGNFTFRTIEFEQMEYQTFCKKDTDEKQYDFFKDYGMKFMEYIGLNKEKLRYKDHEKLAHYAKNACDIEYLFPFGWGEINGTHNRTDFDLKNHQELSKVSMEYLDEETGEKYIPYIIESTYGVDRIILALLFDAYNEEEDRIVLKLNEKLAPIKASVLPLIKKYHAEKAEEIYNKFKEHFMTSMEDSGSIGKRYKRNDAIGIPYSITIDDETLKNNKVTIRFRDTAEQQIMDIDEAIKYIEEKTRI